MAFRGSKNGHSSRVELTDNNSHHSSIQWVLYKALCDEKCAPSLDQSNSDKAKLLGTDIIQRTVDKLKFIRERNSSESTFRIQVGDWVLLKVSHMKGVTGVSRKIKLSRDIWDLIKSLVRQARLPVNQTYYRTQGRYIQCSTYLCFANALVILPECFPRKTPK